LISNRRVSDGRDATYPARVIVKSHVPFRAVEAPPIAEFSVHPSPGRHGTVIGVRGELDIATVPELARCIAKCEAPLVIVDMSQVTFIDSSGIRCLLGAYRVFEASSREFAIAGASGPVEDILRMTGLDVLLPMAPSVDSAAS